MSIFSETLVFLRERSSISRETLSDTLGVSVSHIKRLETDYIAPDEDILKRIADFFSVTTQYLLGTVSREIIISEPGFGDLSGKFLSVPVLGTRCAMKSKIYESEIIERIIIPTPGNKKCNYIGILIEDDASLLDRLRKNDIAIVEITNQLAMNDIVAVSYKGGEVFFKKYSRLGPTIILSSDNNFDIITYDVSDTDYNIIGKVVSFQGKI